MVSIIQGDALAVIKTLPAESVNCCVSSPPYWGLRDYGIPPSIWGGEASCEHDWNETIIPGGSWDGKSFRRDKKAWHTRGNAQPGFCNKCGAWKGCVGLEPTPDLYVEHIVTVFRDVRRVLRGDGTLWLNLGDSYTSTGRSDRKESPGVGATQEMKAPGREIVWKAGGGSNFTWNLPGGQKPKDLVGIPWMTAFALRADGWYLRRDIIWEKPNCMPESCKDRPTTSHEYIFLLSKSAKCYYDFDAVKVPCSPDTHPRYARGRSDSHKYADGGPGGQTIARSLAHMVNAPGVNPKAKMGVPTGWDTGPGGHRARVGRYKQNPSFSTAVKDVVESRNLRSVWRIPSKGFSGAHFATFPPKLIEPCILAGCPAGGTVLDPFGGSGTVGLVAESHGRNSILIELNPKYVEMAKRRTAQVGIFNHLDNPESANL